MFDGVGITPPEPGRSFSESFGDALALENTLGSMASNHVESGRLDPTFNFRDHMQEGDEEWEVDLAKSMNEKHFYALREQINKEQKMRDDLAKDGGWGIAAYLAAGILDPINLIPVGGAAAKAYKSGKILHGFAAGALTGGVAAAGTEAILQGTQQTRTQEEAAINIAAGTFLSGFIGGAVAGVGKLGRNTDDFIADIQRGVEQDLDLNSSPPIANLGSVGAAAADEIPPSVIDDIEAKITEDIRSGKIADDDVARGKAYEAYAAQAVRDLSGAYEPAALRAVLNGIPIPGTKYEVPLANVLKYQTPVIRGLYNDSVVHRRIMGALAETGMERGVDRVLDATVEVPVERMMELWQGGVYTAIKNMDDLYLAHITDGNKTKKAFGQIALERAKTFGKVPQGKMSYKDFRTAVGQAMIRGDMHPDPQVQAAAQMWRKEVYDPLKEAAIEVGLLPEDVATETAISYLNRVWDVQKINANRGTFKNKIFDYLKGKQREAINRDDTWKVTERVQRLEEVKGLKRQIDDIGDSVYKGVYKGAVAETGDMIDRALDRMPAPEGMPKVEVEKAKKAAKRAFDREFKKELEEAIDEEVRLAVQEDGIEAVENAVARAFDPEDVDAITVTKEEISEVMPGEAARVAPDDPARIAKAEEAGFEAAQKAYQASLKSQQSKIDDMFTTPGAMEAENLKAARAELIKSARATARSTAQKAAREATAELREQLGKKTKELAKRKKEAARDSIEARLDDADLQEIAGEITDRITGIGGNRLQYSYNIADAYGKVLSNKGKASPFKARSLLVEDKDFEKFLDQDIENIGRRLTDQMAPQIELMRRFKGDDLNLSKTLDDLRTDWERIFEQRGLNNEDNSPAMVKKRKKWESDRAASFRDVEAVRDRLLGVYGMPDDPTAITPRVAAALRHYNYIRLLGGMTITAISDLARPIMVQGWGSAWQDALKPMMTDFATVRRATAELRDMGVVMDMVLNSRATKWAGLTEPMGNRSILEKGLQSAADTFGIASLMSPWNAAAKQITGLMSQQSMIRYMKKMIAGKATKKEIAYLKGNYIDLPTARKIMEMVDKFGETNEKGFVFPNSQAWTGEGAHEALTRLRAAIGRDIDRTIITPGQDIPLWATKNDFYKLIFQFKSFGVAAVERMLLAGLQKNDINVHSGMGLAIALGMLSYATKETLSGRKLSDKPEVWVLEGIDRSGITGWLFEANNMVERLSGGTFGINPMVGGEVLSRYASRNFAGALLGPSFGSVQALGGVATQGFQSTFGDDTWDMDDTIKGLKLLPYSSLFYLKPGLSALSD